MDKLIINGGYRLEGRDRDLGRKKRCLAYSLHQSSYF